jgi:hypothetical protein
MTVKKIKSISERIIIVLSGKHYYNMNNITS